MKSMNVAGISIVIGAVLIGGYFILRTEEPAPAAAPTTSAPVATVTITVDDEGFTPQEITIAKNTEVVFENTGTRPHWPASDIHPTHGIYPAFDPQRPVSPGESWSFVFDKPGSWRMHDHLSPRALGRITVTE